MLHSDKDCYCWLTNFVFQIIKVPFCENSSNFSILEILLNVFFKQTLLNLINCLHVFTSWDWVGGGGIVIPCVLCELSSHRHFLFFYSGVLIGLPYWAENLHPPCCLSIDQGCEAAGRDRLISEEWTETASAKIWTHFTGFMITGLENVKVIKLSKCLGNSENKIYYAHKVNLFIFKEFITIICKGHLPLYYWSLYKTIIRTDAKRLLFLMALIFWVHLTAEWGKKITSLE